MMVETSLPEGTSLLGTSLAPLPIRGEESSIIVKLGIEGHRLLASFLAASQEPRSRVYLILEHIRGNYDATMLNVYISLSANINTQHRNRLLVGSKALFGLRMASLKHAENPGEGLTASFDITPLLLGLLDPLGTEVSINIVPSRPLPESVDLVVEQVSLYHVAAREWIFLQRSRPRASKSREQSCFSLGPSKKGVKNERVVSDGNLISTDEITLSINGALYLLETLEGNDESNRLLVVHENA
jgi:hypothetical protein